MKTIQGLKKLGILKDHNIPTYLEMEELFDGGENRVGVVQATGTGKSFVAFQFLYDNVFSVNKEVYSSKELFKDGKYRAKRAVVLEPRQGIVFRFNELCEKLCRELHVPFDDVIVARYDQLKLLTDEELKLLDFDYIILDEFHRLGAEGRGTVTQRLLLANPNAKILGLTATPIRYLDKKRDMGDELFGDNIVCGLNVAEAIRAGVLPNPEYVMAVRSYEETAKIIEDKINAIRDKKTRELYKKELEELRRHPEFAKGLKETFERKIQKKNGKFIAFCTDTEKLQSLRNEIEKGLLSGVNKTVKIYQVTYKDKKEDVERAIKAFEEDKSDCFKIMLAVDMFNEGIHISDVDGCFLFRPTISPEVYTQQIGRVLSFRDDKDFHPQIFDIVNNLQNYEKILLAFEAESADGIGGGSGEDGFNQSIIPFEITGSDEDLYNRLRNLYDEVSRTLTTKEQWLAAAERYVKERGDLNIPRDYIEQGTELKLGSWLHHTKNKYNHSVNLVNKDVAKNLSKLDEHWFEYTRENSNFERDRKIIVGVRAWPKDKTIPHNAPSPVDKTFNLGGQITQIKQFLRGLGHCIYSQELVGEIIRINPYALKTQEEINAERDVKIIAGVRAWPKNKTIPQSAVSPVDETFNLGNHIANLKQFLKGNRGATQFSQKLIDEVNRINPYALKTQEEINAERDEKIIAGIRAWPKDKTIPYNAPSPVDKTFNLGGQISTIKRFLKENRGAAQYSQELIDEINRINPYALKTQEEINADRGMKIIAGVRAWSDKNGNKPIPQDAVLLVDKSFSLGRQIHNIKQFLQGKGTAKYSQELIDEITKINPYALKTQEEMLAERDVKIVAGVRAWSDKNGNKPIPQDAVSLVDKSFSLGRQIRNIKQFLQGKGTAKYSQELIDEINEINPEVLKTRTYNKGKELS